MSCRLTLALALAAAGASAFDCSQRSECCGRTNNKKKETYYLGTLNEIWGSQDKCESKTYCAGKVEYGPDAEIVNEGRLGYLNARSPRPLSCFAHAGLDDATAPAGLWSWNEDHEHWIRAVA
jgi:hypothetical protein